MPISLAKLVKEARLRQGLTQGELAMLAGTGLENITAIENSRNRQPRAELIARLARALELRVEDIYGAITGTLNHLPWEKVGDLDLKDPELELMFRQVDDLSDEDAKGSVKDFIRFTLARERRRLQQEMEQAKRQKS